MIENRTIVLLLFSLLASGAFCQSAAADDVNKRSWASSVVERSFIPSEFNFELGRNPEEDRRYWLERENSGWERMFILFVLQIDMPGLGYYSRYDVGNAVLGSFETLIGTSFLIDGLLMYGESYAKNKELAATLKVLGGMAFLGLAYYQFTVVGGSDPDSRFLSGYLAYQLAAIPLELYAITVEY